MLNNKQYFALVPQPNGTLRKICPNRIWKSSYQGIEMFVYQHQISDYRVIEKSTGLPIAVSKLSKNDALARSKYNIDSKGVEQTLKEITDLGKAIEQMTIYEEIE